MVYVILTLAGTEPANATDCIDANIELTAAYRVDHFDWSIAAQGGSPNIAEELVWDDVRIAQLGLRTSIESRFGLLLEAQGAIGAVIDGDNRDSDYLGNNRTNEFSRSINESNGYVGEASVAIGNVIRPWCQWLRLTPLVGFSFHTQRYTITDGRQTISSDPALLGPIRGLNSHYHAKWWGRWAGLRIAIQPLSCLTLHATGEYHLKQNYYAEGLFNLRSDAKDDFFHDANAYGYVILAGTEYVAGNGWTIGASGKYEEWTAERGRHRNILFTPGTSQFGIFIDTTFNGACWWSYSASLNLKKEF